MIALTWLFCRLVWALAQDDIRATFYRATVSALAFFALVWLPLVIAATGLPRGIQDTAFIASFPATGAVFWFGPSRATKDGTPATCPILNGTAHQALWRLGTTYGMFVLAIILAVLWQA